MKTEVKLLLSAVEAAKYLGISERQFHYLRLQPGFPPARELGARCKRWRICDLDAYVEGLPTATRAPQPEWLAHSQNRERRGGSDSVARPVRQSTDTGR